MKVIGDQTQGFQSPESPWTTLIHGQALDRDVIRYQPDPVLIKRFP